MNARVWFCLLTVLAASQAKAAPPDPLIIPSKVGDVEFSHLSHEQTECVACHHTSPGRRIKRSCRDCHTSDSSMPRNSRDAFHDSCISCHLDLLKKELPTGPAKRCGKCHQDND